MPARPSLFSIVPDYEGFCRPPSPAARVQCHKDVEWAERNLTMTFYSILWCLVFVLASWSFAMFAFGYSVGRAYRPIRKAGRG